VTETAVGVAAAFQAREAAGELSREEAFEGFATAARAMWFDGNEYLFAYRLDGTAVMHAARPELEGTSLWEFKDPNGLPIVQEFVRIVRDAGEGRLSFLWPRAGQEQPVEKLGYAIGFEPWGIFIGTGVYVDDVRAEVLAVMLRLGAAAGLVVVVLAGAGLLLGRSVTAPLARLRRAMASLAEGRLDIALPDSARRDEIGDMARAVLVFKQNAEAHRALEQERAADAERSAAERRSLLSELAGEFEQAVGAVVAGVTDTSGQVQHAAERMNALADRGRAQSTEVAAATEEASTNVQTVASAAEELSSSIAEIGRQIAGSAQAVRQAVGEADAANGTVASLGEAADRIGDVVKLIQDIAEQTNLLALNATIEAARAGEAGKGFAVVASEVKNLANQTARATEEISGQIGRIQSVSGEAAQAIGRIGQSISGIDEMVAAIAAAAEQQGAATAEISRNAGEAAGGTRNASRTVDGLRQAAQETGGMAEELLGSARGLGEQSGALRRAVEGFVARLRAAA